MQAIEQLNLFPFLVTATTGDLFHDNILISLITLILKSGQEIMTINQVFSLSFPYPDLMGNLLFVKHGT